jgi:26S proteasome regulatory subunit T2
MNLDKDVHLEEIYLSKDNISGADIKGLFIIVCIFSCITAICTEAGMFALRKSRICVCQSDFIKAKEKVLYRKKEGNFEGLYV